MCVTIAVDAQDEILIHVCLCQPKENHAMSSILFHSRKLLVSCDVDKDCLGSQCCRDSRCTSKCDEDPDDGDDFLWLFYYVIPIVLFLMFWICSCVYKQSKKRNARAARRAAILLRLQQNVQLYREEISRVREFQRERYAGPLEYSANPLEHPDDPQEHSIDGPELPSDSIEHSVNPPEHTVHPLEYSVGPQELSFDSLEHPVGPPEYSVHPPEYPVDPPGYSVHPPEYSVDPPHPPYVQPPSYFV